MKKLKTKLKFEWWWLLIFGVWFLIYKFIKRSEMIVAIERALPLREAGLLAGMVWGERGGIRGDLYKMLINTGLVHMVVVSGANLTIVGKNLIEVLAKYIGRRMAIIWGGGVILIYVNLVGWQIPVIRALLFLGIYYLAQILGRRFRTDRGLFLVGLMMVLADFGVLSDVSFWLSMMAFLGVIVSRDEGVFKNTLWVSLLVLPILSLKFGTISLLTPISNLAVLFLVEILTIMGFVGSILSLWWQFLGKIILGSCYPLLRYLIEVVEGVGKWKVGVVNFQFNWWMLAGWYLIIGAYWYEKKKV